MEDIDMENTRLFGYNEELNEEQLSDIAGGCWFKVCKKCRAKKKEEKKTPWYIKLIRKESNKYEKLLNSF